MSILLVSGLERKFLKKGEKKICVGNWLQDEKITNEKFCENDFFMNDEREVVSFTNTISHLYEKIINNLHRELNKLHNVNFDLRAWKVIIDPWITYYLENIYFRWKIIRDIIKDNKEAEIKFLNFKKLEYLPPFDQNEFHHLVASSSTYNHNIFQKILIYFSKKNKELALENIDQPILKTENYNYVINDKKISKLKKISEKFFSLLSFKNKTYLDINCGIYDYLRLCIYLKQIPYKANKFFLRKNLIKLFNLEKNVDYKIRENLSLNFDKSDDFENFLSENFCRDIPQCLIEKFEDIKKLTQKILIRPKIILSDINHKNNTIFKFWIMDCLKENTKLITTDHGGIYGNGMRAIHFDEEISDTSLKWHKPMRKTNFQLPVMHLLRFENYRIKYQKRDKLLIICHDASKYPKHFSVGPIANQTLRQLYFIKNLNNNLDTSIIKKQFIRPYFADNGWRINEKLKNFNMKNNFLLNKYNDYRNCMKRSKLIVVTYPKTAFYESLLSGPTILLYEPRYYRENKELKEVINSLKKVRIVFDDPLDAAKHINKYWNNLNNWWEANETVKARKFFFTKVALYEKNPFLKWKKFIQKNLDE